MSLLKDVLTQSSNEFFNICPQASGHSFQYTTYLYWLTLGIIGLNGRHKILASSIPTCLQSPNFNSSLHFKQQSSGPSEIQKSSYKLFNCRGTSDGWCQNRREQNLLFNDEGGTLNIKLLLCDQRIWILKISTEKR